MQRLIARLNIDPYLLLLLSTVALASVLPARGVFADIAGGVADAGIALLFFGFAGTAFKQERDVRMSKGETASRAG